MPPSFLNTTAHFSFLSGATPGEFAWNDVPLFQLLSVPAQRRRERSTELRIKNAKFRDPTATLETFDWKFNGQYLDRGQMEELATGGFIGRRDNLVFVGQSGLGKSDLIQAIGAEVVSSTQGYGAWLGCGLS